MASLRDAADAVLESMICCSDQCAMKYPGVSDASTKTRVPASSRVCIPSMIFVASSPVPKFIGGSAKAIRPTPSAGCETSTTSDIS